MNEPEKLSLDDISRLIEDPSSISRIEIADKLARQYRSQQFAPEQVKLAEQIFRLLMRDAETFVRKALADNLKEVKTVPRDVILQLARDVEEISLPILEFSEVLTDDDLISIISSTVEVTRQLAITRRTNISNEVSSALVDTNNSQVVSSLLNNQSANISEDSFTKIGANFHDNKEILQSLVKHSAISVEAAERVMEKVSIHIKDQLETKYKGSMPKLGGLFDKSKESAVIQFIGAKTSDEELMRLINHLEQSKSIAQEFHNKDSKLARMVESLELSGKLTPFTALCMGSLSLFEITVARLAKVPIYNAKKLITDDGDQGLKAIYEKAKLPESMFQSVKILIGVVKGISKEKPDEQERLKKPEALASYMIQKIMSITENQEIENLNYFLSMISLHAKKEVSN